MWMQNVSEVQDSPLKEESSAPVVLQEEDVPEVMLSISVRPEVVARQKSVEGQETPNCPEPSVEDGTQEPAAPDGLVLR